MLVMPGSFRLIPDDFCPIPQKAIFDVAFVWRRNTDDHAYRGRLPCPVRSEKAENAPAPHVEAQVIYGCEIAEALGDVRYAKGDVGVGHVKKMKPQIYTDEHIPKPFPSLSVCIRVHLWLILVLTVPGCGACPRLAVQVR